MLCRNSRYLLCYKKGKLLLKDSNTKKTLHTLKIHSSIKSLRLVERLLRYEPRASVSIDENTFLYSDHGFIYRYDARSNVATAEHKFDKGMNNPISFCTRYDKDGKLVDLLYGEYIWNQNHGPVAVYRRINEKWIKVYEFPVNTILHIHNIVYDKYRNRYLILTGDTDNESGIWEADYNFKNVNPIIKGLQKYRACVAFPTAEGIFYATDTPLETNYLYKLIENENRMEINEICKMPGPCIFGRILNDTLYLATSVEGDPTLGKIRYKFSNKLGRGVVDRYSHLIQFKNNEVKEIGKFKKDCLPMWIFQFGNMQFSQSDDEKLYICPQSCVNKYGTYEIDI